MAVPTLPWLMEHLPTDKAAGPAGDRYEHYKCMPYEYVAMLVDSALNGRLPQPVQKVWRTALVYAGDKQRPVSKTDPRKAIRPLSVGMALRRIAERVPAAQLRAKFADKFKSLRRLGVAVLSGIEIAYRIVDNEGNGRTIPRAGRNIN